MEENLLDQIYLGPPLHEYLKTPIPCYFPGIPHNQRVLRSLPQPDSNNEPPVTTENNNEPPGFENNKHIEKHYSIADKLSQYIKEESEQNFKQHPNWDDAEINPYNLPEDLWRQEHWRRNQFKKNTTVPEYEQMGLAAVQAMSLHADSPKDLKDSGENGLNGDRRTLSSKDDISTSDEEWTPSETQDTGRITVNSNIPVSRGRSRRRYTESVNNLPTPGKGRVSHRNRPISVNYDIQEPSIPEPMPKHNPVRKSRSLEPFSGQFDEALGVTQQESSALKKTDITAKWVKHVNNSHKQCQQNNNVGIQQYQALTPKSQKEEVYYNGSKKKTRTKRKPQGNKRTFLPIPPGNVWASSVSYTPENNPEPEKKVISYHIEMKSDLYPPPDAEWTEEYPATPIERKYGIFSKENMEKLDEGPLLYIPTEKELADDPLYASYWPEILEKARATKRGLPRLTFMEEYTMKVKRAEAEIALVNEAREIDPDRMEKEKKSYRFPTCDQYFVPTAIEILQKHKGVTITPPQDKDFAPPPLMQRFNIDRIIRVANFQRRMEAEKSMQDRNDANKENTEAEQTMQDTKDANKENTEAEQSMQDTKEANKENTEEQKMEVLRENVPNSDRFKLNTDKFQLKSCRRNTAVTSTNSKSIKFNLQNSYKEENWDEPTPQTVEECWDDPAPKVAEECWDDPAPQVAAECWDDPAPQVAEECWDNTAPQVAEECWDDPAPQVAEECWDDPAPQVAEECWDDPAPQVAEECWDDPAPQVVEECWDDPAPQVAEECWDEPVPQVNRKSLDEESWD